MNKRRLRPDPRNSFVISSDSTDYPDLPSESEPSSEQFADSDSELTNSDFSEQKVVAAAQKLREIALPDWKTHRTTEKIDDPAGFNAIQVHSRLELIEARIIAGELADWRHPAQVVDAAEAAASIAPTAAEDERAQRYQTIVRKSKIPSFWAAREWDRKSDAMTALASQKLADEIYFVSHEHLKMTKEAIEVAPPPVTRTEKRRRTRRQKVVIAVPKLDYLTDHCDEQTDCEW